MSIANVISRTLKRFKAGGEMLTPDNFQKIFCQEAKKEGFLIEDCNKVQKFLNKLPPDLKLKSNNYNIRNLDELIAFLIGNIKHQTISKKSEREIALEIFLKKIFIFLSKFPDNEIKNIATNTIKTDIVPVKNIMYERSKWIEFIDNYNFSYLNLLDDYGKFDKTNLRSFIEDIDWYLKKQDNSKENLGEFILEMTTNSSDQNIKEKGRELSIKLQQKDVDYDRVFDDIKDLFNDVKNVGSFIIKENGKKLKNILNSFKDRVSSSMEKVDLYRQNITDLPIDNNSLQNIVEDVTKHINSYSENLKTDFLEIEKLKNEIKHLEDELEKKDKESRLDSLTKVLNRRTLLKDISILEKHSNNYWLVFFKPDDFEKLSDSIGRLSSDVVLSAIGSILNKNIINNDFVGRYSGSVFLMILLNRDKDEIITFINNILESTKHSKFIYEDKKFNVTASCGISLRSKHQTLKDAIAKADENIIKARVEGGGKLVIE